MTTKTESSRSRPAQSIADALGIIASAIADMAATGEQMRSDVRATAVAFDIKGAAAAVKVSASYLTREIHAGRLPAKKVGPRYRIGAIELREWFEHLPDAE